MQQRLATALLGVLLGIPHLVAAQDSNGLESVARQAKAGSRLSVVTTDGKRLRARFDHATPSDLIVSVRDKTVILPVSKVARVIKHDSPWNGAGYGALAGAAIGGVLGATGEPVYGEGWDALFGAATLGGIGLGVGWAIDRFQYSEVYRGGPQVTVRPHLSSFTPPGATKAGARTGVTATVAW